MNKFNIFLFVAICIFAIAYTSEAEGQNNWHNIMSPLEADESDSVYDARGKSENGSPHFFARNIRSSQHLGKDDILYNSETGFHAIRERQSNKRRPKPTSPPTTRRPTTRRPTTRRPTTRRPPTRQPTTLGPTTTTTTPTTTTTTPTTTTTTTKGLKDTGTTITLTASDKEGLLFAFVHAVNIMLTT